MEGDELGKLTEAEFQKCLTDTGSWICPVPDCLKVFSRRQTLQSHLAGVHSIEAGLPKKRYKQYEYDECIAEPRRTKSRRLQTQCEQQTDSASGAGNDSSTYNRGPTCTNTDRPLDMPVEFDEIRQITDMWEDDYVTAIVDMEISDEGCSQESSCSSAEASEDEAESIDSSSTVDTSPLYVLPPSENVYVSSITHKEHLLSLCTYASKQNLSNSAFKQLMQLVNIHLPPNNVCEGNVSAIKEECGFNNKYMKYHDYCDRCGGLFPQDTTILVCQTPNCDNTRYERVGDKHGKHFFVSGDINNQLNEVLGHQENWEQISYSCNRTAQSEMYDIQDGDLYKELKSHMPVGETHVTLTVFTDGVSLFKSTKVSFWPVYLVVNELTPKTRFLRKNMILWGLWQGVGKPRMNTFLHPFVVEIRKLYNDGITVNLFNDEKKNVKISVFLVTMDLQARAYMLNMTQHNGQCGCCYCEESGDVVKKGRGHCRCYPYRKPAAILRTCESVKVNVDESLEKGRTVKGFNGETVLSHLPLFKIPNHVAIDYMHGILLGAVKKLMTVWFDGKSYRELYFIGHKLKDVDKRLVSIQPPYLIHRTPRMIENNIKHWKASEFRNWLLYYSIPCLQGILPDMYLQHYSCLVEGIFILLGDRIITSQLQRAGKLLDTFYELFAELYGINNVGINIHNVGHLVDCVREYGPLWVYSCFAFESFNGELRKAIHGKGNVCGEVFWAVQREKILEDNVKALEPSVAKEFLNTLLRSTPANSSYETGYQCSIMKPTTELEFKSFSGNVQEQVLRFLPVSQNKVNAKGNILKANKILRNDFVFYSKSCSRVKKRISYVIQIEEKFQDCMCVSVEYYLFHPESRKVFAVGCGMSESGNVIERRVPHLKKLHALRPQLVIPAEMLKEPLVFMSIDGDHIIANFPNNVERD